MANRYRQITNIGAETHFSAAVTGELAYSRMVSNPMHLTTFNAGDIVPVYCLEVLPHDTIKMDLDSVIRQNTLLTPTMGNMVVDFYAFFVPNRVVNHSWKNVMGENSSGSWTAPEVQLAPLWAPTVEGVSAQTSVQIPVGSVADYYGFPTQQALPTSLLAQMHDLKFRGYLEIYNEFFRDQNYQPPVPYSKLNIFNGFLMPVGSTVYAQPVYGPGSSSVTGTSINSQNNSGVGSDGSYSQGAIVQALYGAGNAVRQGVFSIASRTSQFSALGAPLKANKLHDYFTSVLPSPSKGPDVLLPIAGNIPVVTGSNNHYASGAPLNWSNLSGTVAGNTNRALGVYGPGDSAYTSSTTGFSGTASVVPANLYADLSQISAATIADLRTAAAVQQIYETSSRCGSRYREYIRGFFGLEVDDPYKDIPSYLGHIRRDLELYQTAQTSSSVSGGTPQGNLAAFGYTSTGGHLFEETFLEHGYVHVLAVVRHKNIYSSFLARDNFRLSMLDFYQPPLANISEQPVYTREINPFLTNDGQVFGYQEAWAEYRYDPDFVTGYMRPGVSGTLSLWNYADEFNPDISISTGSWLESNSAQVLDRSLAVTSAVAPQFKAQIRFYIDKERPMPTYSVPGLDIF